MDDKELKEKMKKDALATMDNESLKQPLPYSAVPTIASNSSAPPFPEMEDKELSEVIESFMANVPANPDGGERDWSSTDMAQAIYEAGYRNLPAEPKLLDESEIQKKIDLGTERAYKSEDGSTTTFDVFPLLQAQLDLCRKHYDGTNCPKKSDNSKGV